jgi:hypothetical protein
MAYKRIIEEEELKLAHRGVMTEMGELEAGKAETHSFEEIKKILEAER